MKHLILPMALAAACSLSACLPGDDEEPGDSGVVEVALRVGDLFLDSATFVVSGRNFSASGIIDLSDRTQFHMILGSLPVGADLIININGTLNDGTLCKGSAPFSVSVGRTTDVNVTMECHPKPNKGSADVEVDIDLCPIIDGISALPIEINLGASTELSVMVEDPDTDFTGITYLWTAPTGGFDTPHIQDTHFTCTEVGSIPVTLVVSDGVCSTTMDITVICHERPSHR